MPFKKTTGHSPKLVIDVDRLITRRCFMAIGICCCNALKRGDRFAMDLFKELKCIGRLLQGNEQEVHYQFALIHKVRLPNYRNYHAEAYKIFTTIFTYFTDKVKCCRTVLKRNRSF